jgi:HlyD family secretion protein
MSKTRVTQLSAFVSVSAAAWLLAATAGAQERQEFSLSEAQSFSPQTISASGRVQAVVCASISPRISGYIVAFGADTAGAALEEGSLVKAGEVLFRLEDKTYRNTVALAQAGLNTAQAQLDDLTAKTRPEQMEQLRQAVAELDARLADRKREEQRFRRLVEQDKTLPIKRLEDVQTEVATLEAQRKSAQARLEQAENGPTETQIAVARAQVSHAQAALNVAQTDLDDTVVKAPFTGLITRRYKSVGAYAASQPPTEVLELTALDKLEVELRLSESYLAAVQPGKTTVVLHSGLLKTQLRAPVARVVGSVDPVSGTFVVRIAVPPGAGLPPGAFVTAEVMAGPPPPA